MVLYRLIYIYIYIWQNCRQLCLDVYYINVSCFHSSDKHTNDNKSKSKYNIVVPKRKSKDHLMEESRRGALCLQEA